MTQEGKPDWNGARQLAAGMDARNASAPPLSEQDRHWLLKEWTDANTLGDDTAQRRIQDKILGRTAPQNKPKTGTDTQNR